MIIADKIIEQRKKLGLSQEELAFKLDISRQAVSKWESNQSVPDLDRILELSILFGVSTDYLLKNSIEQTEFVEKPTVALPVRSISIDETNQMLKDYKKNSYKIAFAAFLCILSPICLIMLSVASKVGMVSFSENLAVVIGIIVMFLFIGVALPIFILCGMQLQKYEYLQKENFKTEYGVIDLVKEQQKKYKTTFMLSIIVGVSACMVSVIPLLIVSLISKNSFVIVTMVSLLLLIVGIGVVFLICAGIRWDSMEKILQEGDCTKRKNSKIIESVSSAYWLIVVAGFLGYSFITNDWRHSWIIWPVAVILFAAIMAILNIFSSKNK